MKRGRMVAKYGARRHTERAKNQRPNEEPEACCHDSSTGPGAIPVATTTGVGVMAAPLTTSPGAAGAEGTSESAAMTTLLLARVHDAGRGRENAMHPGSADFKPVGRTTSRRDRNGWQGALTLWRRCAGSKSHAFCCRQRRRCPQKRRRRLLPIKLANMQTETLQAIWRTVRTIPRGQVATYGTVARLAGLPGRARLVGHALKVAPVRLRLPWHRVVAAGERITFPKKSRQHAEQSRRLRAEGVKVANGRVQRRSAIDLDAMLWKLR
jgi:methylated-DNA-protein-cysteine methyltransferase-like protein